MSTSSQNTKTGGIAILGAKVWFIVSSYAIQFALPRLLPDAAEFGLFRSTMSLVSVLNNVLIVATLQSLSKFVAERENSVAPLLWQGLRIQALIGGGLAIALFALAPWASVFLVDADLSGPLRIAAVVLFFNALYGVLVGTLNGRRLFVSQARLDATFSTLRSSFIVGGAILGTAFAALAGWAAAVIVITLIAAFTLRKDLFSSNRSEGSTPTPRDWVAFMAPLWAYQIGLNSMLLLDVQVLKKSLGEAFLATGMNAEAVADAANAQIGYYGAAQTFAFVPYQLLLSLTFIIFPMISKATADGDHQVAQSTIAQAMRISLIALVALAAPMIGAPDGMLRIAFVAEYLVAADALRILVVGVVFFTLFVLSSTALTSSGSPSRPAWIAAIGVLVMVLLGSFLVGRAAPEQVLAAMATATATGMFIAFVLAFVAVRKRFGVFVKLSTTVRVAIAGLVGAMMSSLIPHETRLSALLALVVGGLAVLATLFALRELTLTELKSLRKRPAN